MKEWLKDLTLMGMTFLILFLILEVIFRVFHPFGASISFYEPHHLYGFRFTPNKPYWTKLEGGKASGVINSHGWRGSEWSLEKPSGSYRVAVVGDSYIEALQVELDETAVKVAESLLNQKQPRPVEFMNFGRSGATTSEELLFIREEVLDFKPDLVILCFLPNNDIEDITPFLAPNRLRPFFVYEEARDTLSLDNSFIETRKYKLRKFVNLFKQNSALISFAAKQYNVFTEARAKKQRRNIGTQAIGLQRVDSLGSNNPDPRFVWAFELNQLLILEIARIMRGENIEFMLVTLQGRGWKPTEDKKLKVVDSSFDPFYVERTLKRLAATHAFHYVGLQTRFREHWVKTGEELHFVAGHWNYAGNEFVGSVLADTVLSLMTRSERDL